MRSEGKPGGLPSALVREAGWLWAGLRAPGLYLCLLGALVLWALAWQTKTVYPLDVGGPEDNAFVARFNAKEPDPKLNPHPPFTYRWSQGHSEITWPGLGNVPVTVTLRLAAARPGGAPAAIPVTVTVRGQTFPLAVAGELRDYALAAGRGDPLAGDLRVDLDAPVFHAPGDPRPLGVLVDGATVTPAGLGEGRPGVVPPPADLGRWAAALALLWLLVWRLAGCTQAANAAAAAAAGVVAVLVVVERPNLGLLAPEAPVLLLEAYPLALLARAAAAVALRFAAHAAEDDPLRQKRLRAGLFPSRRSTGGAISYSADPSSDLPSARGGRGPACRWGGEDRAAAAAAAALVAGFLLRVGGMVYPQFISSDIMLHVHNIQKVLAGTLVWTGALPNGAPQPYPPLPYLALAPFAGLVPDLTLLLRGGVGLLDAACVLPLLYVGARLGGPAAGAWAGWVYALLPAPFALFSAGVFSNLFGAAVFTWTLAVWGALILACHARPGLAVALATGFFLTFLSHYGMLIAAVAVAGGFVVLTLIAGPPALRARALLTVAALGVAGAVAFAVYYVHFLAVLLAPAGGVGAQVASGFAADRWLAVLGQRLGPDLGGLALLVAGAGWAGGRGHGTGRLAGGATLAALGFAALSLVAGENVRYALLLAPFVAVGGGLALARIGQAGRGGPVWTGALLGALVWHLLSVWVPLIFTRYH